MKKYEGATSGRSCWIAALMFPLIWPILDKTDKPMPIDRITITAPSFGPVIAERAQRIFGLCLNLILSFLVPTWIAKATNIKKRKEELIEKAVQSVSLIDPVK